MLASTGSGKSYTASVLLEEMMQPDSRAAVLIADPHGEYGSLEQMKEDKRFQGEDGYSPEIEIKRPKDIKVKISELSLSDLFTILDDPSNAQEQVLAEAWNRLQNNDDDYISLNQLKNMCHQIGEEKEMESSARALDWRLNKALNRDLFDNSKNLSLPELLQPGQCSILQLDTMSLRDQQMMMAVLLRKINKARIDCEKGRANELDFPVFILLEEGHRFAPAGGSSRCAGILRTILSEGRKFGIGIGIISQRPSKIDDDVLSQCRTQIIMQLQNPLDQDAVKKSVEDVGEDLLNELPGLTPGQAIVAGDSVNTPFLVKIRERYTKHQADSLEATKLWKEKWELQNRRKTTGVISADDDEGVEDREELL